MKNKGDKLYCAKVWLNARNKKHAQQYMEESFGIILAKNDIIEDGKGANYENI